MRHVGKVAFLLWLVWAGGAGAHTLNLFVENREDGTLIVSGRFNTGQSAAGATLRIVANPSGKVLFSRRLPLEGELDIAIPQEPYTIVLDGGPGHRVEREGPVPPGGFLTPAEGSGAKGLGGGQGFSPGQVLWGASLFMWALGLGLILRRWKHRGF